ncbi:reverse transcriptase domain-containing protein [Tanacetum coccineum]
MVWHLLNQEFIELEHPIHYRTRLPPASPLNSVEDTFIKSFLKLFSKPERDPNTAEGVGFAIVSATSSSEYSWLESKLKLGDLNSSRLSVLKCLLDDRNSRSGSLHGYAVSSLMDTAYWSSEQNCHGHNLSKGNIIKIFYHGHNEITQEALNATAGGNFIYKTPNQAYQLLEDKVLLKLDWAKNQKPKSSLKKNVAFAHEGGSNSDTDKNMARMDAMTLKIDAQYKEIQSRSNHSTTDYFVILEMEEDNKVPLILGRPFLYNVDTVIRVKQKQLNLGVGTERMTFSIDSVMKHSYSNDDTCFSIDVIDEIIKEDFDALLDEEDIKSDNEEPTFEKITFDTDYKIKTSLEEPPTDIELKQLCDHLEYVFLEEPSFLLVIISSQLSEQNKDKLVSVLKRHKQAFAWKTTNILVVKNKKDELVPARTVMGWRVCIDYRKFNKATTKDHHPLPFMDQMLERLVGNKYFCFLDGFSGYFKIPIDPIDQEKTTFTCPFRTYAYRRMPFGLCNAPATFQRCMLAIFHDMIKEFVEVFMDEFSIFRNP